MQCPKCQFENPEGMKICGGSGLALKGPQHDEARLIFLDMVPNLKPTFEQKAEALNWFPHVPHLVQPVRSVQSAMTQRTRPKWKCM